MDKDFEAILVRMQRRRRIEALTTALAIFVAGCAFGFALAAVFGV